MKPQEDKSKKMKKTAIEIQAVGAIFWGFERIKEASKDLKTSPDVYFAGFWHFWESKMQKKRCVG